MRTYPSDIAFKHPRTGEITEVPIRSSSIAMLVRAALYSAEFSTLLPLVVDRAYEGDFAPLAALMEPWDDITSKMSQGMFYSVICAEDVPYITEEEHSGLQSYFIGDDHSDMVMEICGFWPRGEVPDDYHDPVTTDHPTLVLSGEYDPVTPPSWGELTAKHLPNSTHVTVPGVGHGTTAYGCVPKLIAQFVDVASTDSLDTHCVNKLRRPPFFTSYTGPSPTAEEDAP